MSYPINLLVIDLSHFDGPGTDYAAVKAAGLVGVVYKATQGSGYGDLTYAEERTKATSAGLLWGAFHFGDNSNVSAQAENFLNVANISNADLFCLDFEDNSPNTMSGTQAKEWISEVETKLNRLNQCVLYSGDLIKNVLNGLADPFWSARRLWLAEYADQPVTPPGWNAPWLWQYTDGTNGPAPHTVTGAEGNIDCNSYAGTPAQLAAAWATGQAPVPPPPISAPAQPLPEVVITIKAPAGVKVTVVQS